MADIYLSTYTDMYPWPDALVPPSAPPVRITVELLLNGTWTDISPFVYQRDDITITGGRQDEASKPTHAKLALTLNNRDGRFSPNYTGGAYYPYIGRNTRIRLSVSYGSYSGYRFLGEVPNWPPLSDPTGQDVFVSIRASGPLRRIKQGGGKGSALTRYYQTLTGAYVPVAYWPCEEDRDTSILGAGIDGGTDMTVTTGKPTWKAISQFDGSVPVGILNKSTWDGLTGSLGAPGTSGDDVFDMPGTYTWTAPGGVTTVYAKAWAAGGGGGDSGTQWGGGAGGGEYAEETALAVTPGTNYPVVVGAGGSGGNTSSGISSTAGSDTTIQGDSVTVHAHGGGRGTSNSAGAGGTGSGNTGHHDGGGGFYDTGHNVGGGGGGGGGASSAGNTATGSTGATPLADSGPGGDGGSGGTTTTTYTTTYTAVHTHCYQGSDAGNAKINDDGNATQGGDVADTFNGKAKTWITFNTSKIQSDLAGATITKVQVKLQNAHCWYFSGMIVALGYDTQTSFPATKADPTGAHIDDVEWGIGYGAHTTHTVPNSWGTAFRNGSALNLVLFKNSNDLHYYGYFDGAMQDTPPQLVITYTKTAITGDASGSAPTDTPAGGGGGGGGTNTAGGNGAAGRAEMVYTVSGSGIIPNANIIRFMTFVPKHGGNPGKVLLRAKTAGTIAQLDCLYIAGGKFELKGYDSGASLLFTSGQLAANADGQALMVSMELTPSGANVAYKLTAIQPGGSSVIGPVTGTQATATLGAVLEVTAAPNADITKTALGHISVQYALIGLEKVSDALNGHITEMGIDRFIRLCNEQALDNATEFNETADHWGFETGNQSWTGLNGTVTQSAAWASEGTYSLQLTANGSGDPSATGPAGTAGQPVTPGDIVSVAIDMYSPAGATNAYAGVRWYTSSGAASSHPEDDSADVALSAATAATIKATATAPADAATFAATFGDHNADTAGTLLYGDHVRVHPRMGAQTRREYHKFLEEIEDLDQGILKESRKLWGLGYRTRIALINQAPAVTLDYAAAQLAVDVPAPVVDDQKTRNDIVVHRHKGSKVRVTRTDGPMSVLEPPAGAGRYKKLLKVIAETDAQLLALAAHLLGLGTATNERYPLIGVNLTRSEVASLVSNIALAEIGDFVQINNLPFWYPAQTAKQLIIGYNEIITPFVWTLEWNCTPEIPFELVATSIRHW